MFFRLQQEPAEGFARLPMPPVFSPKVQLHRPQPHKAEYTFSDNPPCQFLLLRLLKVNFTLLTIGHSDIIWDGDKNESMKELRKEKG
jgi:hypothetical protein